MLRELGTTLVVVVLARVGAAIGQGLVVVVVLARVGAAIGQGCS